MRRATLIYNPRAGRWRAAGRLREIVAALAGGGYAVEAVATRAPGDATRLATAAVRDGAEAVFSLGGDGTLRETAAGLLGSAVALGPLPAGTSNVVARALGIPSNPLLAAQALANAAVSSHPVGLCAGEPFLMQASTGLDARVLANVRPGLKRRLGQAAVALAAVGQWWRYDYPEIRLSADGRPLAAGFCAACNIPQYGPFRLGPQNSDNPSLDGPSCDDGRLPVVLFAGRSRRRTLAFALDLARGRHLRRADVSVLRVARLEILGPPELRLQLDGCPTELRPPVRIGRASSRLGVLRP